MCGHYVWFGGRAAPTTPSGGVFGGVDFSNAGERERAGAGQVDAQFQRAASGFHKAAQGGEIEIGLPLDLEHRGLLHAKALGDLLLTALGELAQGLEPLDLAQLFSRARLDPGAPFRRQFRHHLFMCACHAHLPFNVSRCSANRASAVAIYQLDTELTLCFIEFYPKM